jgi:ATP-dependent DNA helicase RecG
MTTRTELLESITNGENSGVEFKRDVIENHALAKELVAFSNLSGGMVLLGVEDDGSVSGVTRQNLEEWVMTACRDKIKPPIIPFFEIVRKIEPGKDVAIVRVTRGECSRVRETQQGCSIDRDPPPPETRET